MKPPRHPHLTKLRAEARARWTRPLSEAVTIAFLMALFFAALFLIFSTTNPHQ
mgnify:FL=1